MKILILGGTGAIGTPLIAILRQNQDIQICVTSRSEHSSEENVQYLKADVLNQSELENILMRNHWDAVIDFMIYSESVFRQRIGLLLKSTDQYFFLSSATEYSDLDEIITEKTPRLLDVTTDKELLAVKPYPINKALCENILRQTGLTNWTIVRPYITFNSNRLQLGCYEKELWLWRCLNGGEVLFSKDIAQQYTTFTFAKDVAFAISKLIGNDKAFGEDFTITTNQSLKWNEILDIYKMVLLRERNIKMRVKWTDESLNLRFRQGQWHAKYDRLYNRRFNNAKLMGILPDLKFTEVKKGLEHCLTEFLKTENFRSIPAPCHARLANSYVPLQNIRGIKNRVKQLLVRYMPKPLFNRIFLVIGK